MKIVKRKTKVINLKTKEEIEYESRFAACKSVGMERKRINAYIEKGIVFQKKYKFIDLD
ncbi:MAG: hypothetical protein RSC09_06450 [Clostridia bacterium]